MSTAPPESSIVADEATQALAGARADLSSNDEARTQLRREMTGAQLALALRDLREGVRGMIRVSPLISVMTAAIVGAVWARRRPRKPVRR